MSKKTGIAAIILSILAICVSVYSLYRNSTQLEEIKEKMDIQYVLYLGTNDKDTYEPFGTPDECKAKADEVLTKHFEGFTIQDANGGWTNDNGTVDHEYTIVIILTDTTLDKIQAASDDLIKEFNQSSILIHENVTKAYFYDGSDN